MRLRLRPLFDTADQTVAETRRESVGVVDWLINFCLVLSGFAMAATLVGSAVRVFSWTQAEQVVGTVLADAELKFGSVAVRPSNRSGLTPQPTWYVDVAVQYDFAGQNRTTTNVFGLSRCCVSRDWMNAEISRLKKGTQTRVYVFRESGNATINPPGWRLQVISLAVSVPLFFAAILIRRRRLITR